MTPLTLFSILGIGLVLAVTIQIYNSLVRLANNIEKARANIDVLLKQRSDEVPNLVATVQGYATYEKQLFERVATLRAEYARLGGNEKTHAGVVLGSAVTQLFGLVERYPELQANKNFLTLQERITRIEDTIADRREFLNDSVTIFNTRIQQFPYVIFAKILGYRKKELFEELTNREVPSVA